MITNWLTAPKSEWAERHLDLRFGKDGAAQPLAMPETAATPRMPTP